MVDKPKDEEDYAGKFKKKGKWKDDSVPYLNFWHWVVKHHEVHNGCFLTFCRTTWEEIEEEWVKTIYGHYLDEFADAQGELELYVWW